MQLQIKLNNLEEKQGNRNKFNSSIENKINVNLNYCGVVVDRVVCDKGHLKDVAYNCNIRICDKPKCVKHRSFFSRQIITPMFEQINNLIVFYLTFKYESLDFTDKDLIVKCRECVYEWIDMIKESFGIVRWVINVDVVKKRDGVFHLHFNVAGDMPIMKNLHDRNSFFIFQDVCRRYWKECSAVMADGTYRISVKPKYLDKQRKSALGYFIKRTAQVNPIQKNGVHVKISVKEYVKLFYKRHFITYRKWSAWDLRKVESAILVLSSNIQDKGFADYDKKCEICGSRTYSERFEYEMFHFRIRWIDKLS